MKRDIILSAMMALGVHAAILSAALPEGAHTWGDLREPIALTISPPRKPGPLSHGKDKPSKPVPRPERCAKKEARREPTPIPIKKSPCRKYQPADPVKAKSKKSTHKFEEAQRPRPPEPPPEHRMAGKGVPGDRGEQKEPLEEGTPVPSDQLASLRHHENTLPNPGTSEADGSGRGVITWASPKYQENPPPAYPAVARRRGYEGRALLMIEVLESGSVGRTKIMKSSGFEILDRAALKSVKEWTFIPGTKNGEKTTQWVRFPIRFSLE